MDLGKWASEDYRIPSDKNIPDADREEEKK
jgi:endogenous inhibitor of DNA gyrase (YacG/DUF329 family)